VAPYPHYVIITVDGVTEVAEHNKDDRVAFTDDPDVIRQAVDSVRRGECRGTPDVDPAPSSR
jgi:hypothetical protein